MDTPRWLWLFTVQDVLQDKIVTQSEPKTLRKSNHCERWCLCTLFYFLIFFHSFWMTLYSMVISTPSDIGSQRHCLIFSFCAQFTRFWFLWEILLEDFTTIASFPFNLVHLTIWPVWGNTFNQICQIFTFWSTTSSESFQISVENELVPWKIPFTRIGLTNFVAILAKDKRIYIIELNIQHCTSFHSNWFGQIPRTIHVASPVFCFEDDYVWWSSPVVIMIATIYI